MPYQAEAPTRASPLPAGTLPRGLSRLQAAAYVGVSASLFDEMVDDRRMPNPRMINRRRVWDLRELDDAFDDLPHDGVSAIDPDGASIEFAV